MKSTLSSASANLLGLGLLFLAAVAPCSANVVTPEPADFAIGFGGVALGFVIWRNFRKAK